MTITAAVFTMVYVGVNFVLFFMNLLLPLAVVIVDAVITVFWVIALAGLGDTKYLPLSCTYTDYGYFLSYTYTSVPCRVVKAAFGISFLLLYVYSYLLRRWTRRETNRKNQLVLYRNSRSRVNRSPQEPQGSPGRKVQFRVGPSGQPVRRQRRRPNGQRPGSPSKQLLPGAEAKLCTDATAYRYASVL